MIWEFKITFKYFKTTKLKLSKKNWNVTSWSQLYEWKVGGSIGASDEWLVDDRERDCKHYSSKLVMNGRTMARNMSEKERKEEEAWGREGVTSTT